VSVSNETHARLSELQRVLQFHRRSKITFDDVVQHILDNMPADAGLGEGATARPTTPEAGDGIA
jgi:hypothetical protein